MAFRLGKKPNRRSWLVSSGNLSGKTWEDFPDDPLIQRYLKGVGENFKTDPEMKEVLTFPAKERGYVEALHLGGASIEVISEELNIDESFIELLLGWYFDIGSAASKPILRGLIADAEPCTTTKNLKRFAAKRGWKSFLSQFATPEESRKLFEELTAEEAKRRALLEVVERVDQAAMYAPGTEEAKQLTPFVKMYVDLTKDFGAAEEEVSHTQEKLSAIMDKLNAPSRTKKLRFLKRNSEGPTHERDE